MIICTQMVKHSTVDKFRPYILTLCDLIHFLSRFIAKQFYETNYRQREFWIKLISRSFTKIRLICAHLQRAKMDKLLSYRKKYKILIDYCDGMYYKDIHILFPYFLAHLLERNALRQHNCFPLNFLDIKISDNIIAIDSNYYFIRFNSYFR